MLLRISELKKEGVQSGVWLSVFCEQIAIKQFVEEVINQYQTTGQWVGWVINKKQPEGWKIEKKSWKTEKKAYITKARKRGRKRKRVIFQFFWEGAVVDGVRKGAVALYFFLEKCKFIFHLGGWYFCCIFALRTSDGGWFISDTETERGADFSTGRCLKNAEKATTRSPSAPTNETKENEQ